MGERQQARPLGGTNLRRERRINTVLTEIGAIAPTGAHEPGHRLTCTNPLVRPTRAVMKCLDPSVLDFPRELGLDPATPFLYVARSFWRSARARTIGRTNLSVRESNTPEALRCLRILDNEAAVAM